MHCDDEDLALRHHTAGERGQIAREAERCLAIYRNKEAALRPKAAWELIPYGRSTDDTIAVLVRMPRERVTQAMRHSKVAVKPVP